MTSYFEKLTSINASSLNNLQKQLKDSSLKLPQSPGSAPSGALDKIEELKQLNSKLELDLKCEHDEKADLVSLKVGLENEVLNLREVNERLEFQVEQLRVEKDKIHHVLAKLREESSNGGGSNGERFPPGLFISGGGGSGNGSSFGLKKFPSLDDLSSASTNSPMFSSPSTSPTPGLGLVRVTTPTSIASGGPLERITEEDETLLESLVLSSNAPTISNANAKLEPSSSFSKPEESLNLQRRMEELNRKIAFLESENTRLTRKKFICSKCKRRSNGRRNPGGLFFEDEGLVLSAVDDDDDDEEENNEEDDDADDGFDDEEGAVGGMTLKPPQQSQSDGRVASQANSILEMQRKIIEKLETEMNSIIKGENSLNSESILEIISKMKKEVNERMRGILWIVAKEAKDDDDQLQQQQSKNENVKSLGNAETHHNQED